MSFFSKQLQMLEITSDFSFWLWNHFLYASLASVEVCGNMENCELESSGSCVSQSVKLRTPLPPRVEPWESPECSGAELLLGMRLLTANDEEGSLCSPPPQMMPCLRRQSDRQSYTSQWKLCPPNRVLPLSSLSPKAPLSTHLHQERCDH